MSDRSYRLLFGFVLLLGLYYRLDWVLYALITLALLEGITGLRVPMVVTRLRTSVAAEVPLAENLTVAASRARFGFEAERMLRLTLALVLFLTYVLFPTYLWFVPWFVGFALFGAGVSGVCPSLSLFKWVGFR